jgi:hypothetical protein
VSPGHVERVERCCPAARPRGTRSSPASPALCCMLALSRASGQRSSEVAPLTSARQTVRACFYRVHLQVEPRRASGLSWRHLQAELRSVTSPIALPAWRVLRRECRPFIVEGDQRGRYRESAFRAAFRRSAPPPDDGMSCTISRQGAGPNAAKAIHLSNRAPAHLQAGFPFSAGCSNHVRWRTPCRMNSSPMSASSWA